MSLFGSVKQWVQLAVARIASNHLYLALTITFFVVILSLVGLLMGSDRQLNFEGADQVFQGRDFSRTPFTLMDAYDACVLEAKSKYGSNLLRNHMLPLSTRFDAGKQEYLVVLSADIGTVQEWSEATIYCSIDPVAEKISYYKDVHDGGQSIVSKTMDMLSNALK